MSIYENGTEEQKMKYLPDLLSGKKIGAFGLTEFKVVPTLIDAIKAAKAAK